MSLLFSSHPLLKIFGRFKNKGQKQNGDLSLFCAQVSPGFDLQGVCILEFITYLIRGISLGSVYAIIALGYTMVYGIAKMLNFAHGDIIMIGGYVAFTVMTTLALPSYLAVIAAILFCTLLGVAIERIAYKPLRGATPLAVLITAIGMSYFLQNIALLIFGSDPKMFTSVVPLESVRFYYDGSGLLGVKAFWTGAADPVLPDKLQNADVLTISGVMIVTILVSVAIMIALMVFIKKSKTGRAMLAVSEDKGAAQLMGVNVNKTIAITFAIGSALAAVAGVLLCSAYPTLTPYTGSMPGIKAFVAAVFGGIGSSHGAMVGGILLGIIEIFSTAYISSQLADAIVFSVLIIVLLVKPTGILGKKISEKV